MARKVRRKNILPDVVSGAGFTLGSKVVDDLMRGNKRKRKKNPISPFVGVRVKGSKVQLRIPNRNPGTIRQVKALIEKLKREK